MLSKELGFTVGSGHWQYYWWESHKTFGYADDGIKIWNVLRKRQSWGQRHKQTHKSTNRHREDCGDSICHCCLATLSLLLVLSLPLSHHLTTLTSSLTLLFPFFASHMNPSFGLFSALSGLFISFLIFQPEALKDTKKIFALCLCLSSGVLAPL